MAKIGGKNNKRVKSGHSAQTEMAVKLDQLAQFEQFKEDLLPALREDLRNGLSSKEIIEKYKPYVAARQVSLALNVTDGDLAHKAGVDILNRADGKAKETLAIEDGLKKASKEELEAEIKSLDESIARIVPKRRRKKV